jgi:hypothetical protein
VFCEAFLLAAHLFVRASDDEFQTAGYSGIFFCSVDPRVNHGGVG